MTFNPSPFEQHFFADQEIYIKRDDLLHVDFSGNKARKFHYYLNQDLSDKTRVISYGSNQSNAMYSLSVFAKIKGLDFLYFTDHISAFLELNPIGNYKYALQNGMHIYKSENRDEDAYKCLDEKTLLIDEGGRQKEAEYGIKILADEILENIQQNNIKNPYVFLPSGTGTTALYLQKHLPCKVFTCS